MRGVWDAHVTGTYVTLKKQLNCCSCLGNQSAYYRGCSEWKDAKTAAAKRVLRERGRRKSVSTPLPAPKAAPPKTTPQRKAICTCWNHDVRGGQDFRIANYVCQRTDNQARSGGTAILVRGG
jgi:hypothetical protein